MITIIRAPPERQLREVAGADDEALRHEQERPQPRLDVLERQVAARLGRHARQRGAEGFDIELPAVDAERGVPHLPEGFERQGTDVDRLRGDTEVVHQVQCVGPRALGGAEAGHRQAVDRPAVEAQHVAGRDRDQQREGRIQAARDPDIQRPARGELLDPLGQPRALDAEDLGATAVQLGTLGRDERRARHRTLQTFLMR